MSKTTKRKYVMDEVLVQELCVPAENQSVVKVVASKGNNLHEVEDGKGVRYLMSMPPKYRKSVWVKRGDYVLVEPIAEGDKVRAEMVAALHPDRIKYIIEHNAWPDRFKEADTRKSANDEHLSDLTGNMNRRQDDMIESDETSSEDEEKSSTSDLESSSDEKSKK